MKVLRFLTKHLPMATVALMMAACASEDYVGDQKLHEANDNAPIRFSSDAKVITRSTSNEGSVVDKLDGQFKIYGVKSGATAGSDIQKVFINYSVWNGTANSTTSNSSGWEYVGDAGATGLGQGNISLASTPQTIKYWDYGAADYRFVAGSPVSAFTYTVNSTTNAIESAAITGLAGHLTANPIDGDGTALSANPVYVAKPVKVLPADYKKPVQFEFVRQQAQVRVGIYETIPGYIISNIHFYTNGATTASEGNNVILTSGTAGYFAGGSSVGGTITYDWGDGETPTTPSYTFTYGTGVSTAQNWYGGAFVGTTTKESTTAAIKAITSNDATPSNLFGTDKDMDGKGFFTVLPTPSATTAAPILIKCDYTLKSIEDGSYETINVKGATAAIPAAYSIWKPNTTYTYLFKISDNTNGHTGATSSPEGLFPITFAATESAGGEMGTITTIATPSITTYQEGSVIDQDADNTTDPVTPAVHGIKYVHGTAIYATVQNDLTGELQPLVSTTDALGCVKVFKLADAQTEAELQVTAPTGTDLASLGESEVTIGTATLPGKDSNNKYYYLTFTPETGGYYAIQYVMTAAEGSTPAAYAYKVVYVE